VVNRTVDLFVHLGATDEQLDFPIVYASAINGTATLEINKPGTEIAPLLNTILDKISAPAINREAPLQILVLALAYDSYKGKMGIGKIQSGSIARRQNVVTLTKDGGQVASKVADLAVFSGLERTDVEQADAGEIVAVAGLEEVHIGDTIADAGSPLALPRVTIDEPTVQMTFSVNNSPFAGREGKFLTSRHLRERLFKELETNVSLRVQETDSADRFLVAGRGELHLGVLIEQMRREGYELQVSQPEVILHRDGETVTEPFEELTIQVPSEYQGPVIEEIGRRRGELRHMKLIHGDGASSEMHLEYRIPTRGIMGLKNVLMAKTRGTAILHHVFAGYETADEKALVVAPHGSLVAFEQGTSTAYALFMTQERGELFIGPSVDVYQGMIVGENNREEDLDVNVCKQKHLTNMRAAGSDEALVLTPPREMTLEFAMEYIGQDELVEVTPKSLRLRKRLLNPEDRRKARKNSK
ncbi:MAG: translational GTPase TypA, partial [Nitrospiraceae bacterium]